MVCVQVLGCICVYGWTVAEPVMKSLYSPHMGSGVVRMDPLHFLAGCRTRRLNQAGFVLYLSMFYCVVCWGPFDVLLIFVGM